MPALIRFSQSFCLILASLSLLSLSACNPEDELAGFRGGDPIDRGQGLTRQDYRDMNKAEKLLPNDATVGTALGAPSIPDVAQILAAPRPPKVGNSKLVSVTITDDVPLRDVLFELGRLADVDIEIGPGLEERGVNFRAKDKPFNEVIERISDLAGLRYRVKGGVLRIERDLPYFKNYSLDFLNIVRSSTSTVNVTSNVLSSSVSGGSSSSSSSSSGSGGSGSTGNTGVTSGTTSSINSSAESDLWASLEASIGDILGEAADASTITRTDSGSGAAAAQTAATTTAPAAGAANFVINRQAGVLSVNGSERQHDKVVLFLDLLRRNSSAQVLIEAKIVEVTLNDQFQSGVNWTNIIGELGKTNLSIGNYAPVAMSDGFSLGSNGALSLAVEGGDLDAVLQLTQRFGTTRTLSSPRLHAINNQQAVLTFAQNRVFQNCEVTQGQTSTVVDGSTNTTSPSYSCEINTIPIGIILSILPSVNLDTQEVTLNVRPTLSRQVDEVENVSNRLAAQALGDTTLESFIPIVEVREIDSVMKIRSGGVMIIGGLMEDSMAGEERGVPGVSDIPWLGNAFKSHSEQLQKRELIIFIKASVVNSSGSGSPIDRGIMQKYTTDPRPL
jgi:MSHA biogenesis protein MshL